MEFIRSSFDKFSDFIFRKHHFISNQVQYINDIISLLRKLREAFIQQILRLKFDEETEKIEQRRQSTKPPVVASKASSSRASRAAKPVTTKTVEHKSLIEEIKIVMKQISEDLIRKSEKDLRELFSPVYSSPFKQILQDGMRVKIVDVPDTFRKYLDKEGVIYSVRTKTDDKYGIQMEDKIIIPLTRKQFEVLESGEFSEEVIQAPEEDAIVDEEIAEQIVNEFSDERDEIQEDAEAFIDINEEEEGNEQEDMEYGEDEEELMEE